MKMSIDNIRILSTNPHFYALLIQSFLSGYNKPCKLKTVFMAIPILFYKDSRQRLLKANKKSKINTIFDKQLKTNTATISGKVHFPDFFERYYFFKEDCKKSLIILFSNNKIILNKNYIILLKSIDYNDYKNTVKEWLRCSYYLGIIFANSSENYLSIYLGVD